MAIRKFWAIAYRDLVRNKRRTILTALAVALGMMVMMMMSGLLAGIIDSGLEDNIRINTGHLQLRNENYEIEKLSLLARDLLQDGEEIAGQLESRNGVQSAAPVLWAAGILSTPRESTGVQISGINSGDAFHAAVRDGIVSGDFIQPGERNQIVIGKNVADEMGITVGQRVSLAAGNANGQLQEGIFTVAGLFRTGFPAYDQGTVIMPLEQAQSFTGVGNRVSSVIVMLDDKEATAVVASNLQTPGVQVLTWEDLNSFLLETMQLAGSFYYILYTIVILVVAVLIANTLLMSVFERTREMGILAALGMKGRQIMLMFLFEAIILALIGIAVGVIFGLVAVYYFAEVGFALPEGTAEMVEGMALGTTLRAAFAPRDFLNLGLFMLGMVTLVSLYPAWYASRLEPVKALHSF